MPPEVAEQIFVPFFTTKAQNLGIGLPIARRIAEAHGGTVYLANNDPDAGICMALILPQDDEPATDGATSLA
ncbi:ATP-binding protein [Rhodothermus marinus]|uniref:ATP-binding protein n=1 Tax=Rhodothermus marinus TaxID=29549 RepID=UPI0034E1BF6C